jgi:hypothetical protein
MKEGEGDRDPIIDRQNCIVINGSRPTVITYFDDTKRRAKVELSDIVLLLLPPSNERIYNSMKKSALLRKPKDIGNAIMMYT